MPEKPVLVTGATGYVGGRLVPRLLAVGYRVRALGRSLDKLRHRPWGSHPLIELAQGDVMDAESLVQAAQGLLGRLLPGALHDCGRPGFRRRRPPGRPNLVRAAAEARLDRIIYLGGLGGADDPNLSEHLRSRFEVARILQSGAVPTTFLRAAMILGSGGAAFEILRYLVDRLPVMLTPRWVHTPVQPIAITNVLTYLIGCLAHDETRGQTFDIGGPEVVTYRQLMDIYAQEAHLARRLIIPVPVLTPRLSSYWIHLVTPVPASLAQPLAAGLANPVVCLDNRIREIIPQELLDCRTTIRLALQRIEQQRVETCWSDAGAAQAPGMGRLRRRRLHRRHRLEPGLPDSAQGHPGRGLAAPHPDRRGHGLVLRRLPVGASGAGPTASWGERGSGAAATTPDLQTGDALDFFRVLEIEPGRRLLLLAEMKLPGEATLEFRLAALPDGVTELTQTARFLPHGLLGMAYWYALDPFHKQIYPGMLRSIAAATGKPIMSGPERV